MRPSKRYAMRSYLEQINVANLINSVQSCDDKVSMLETTGLDCIMPLQTRTVISNEPVWITSSLKDRIGKRQKALNSGSFQEFKLLRNCVNRDWKKCRSKYNEANVKHLKNCKSSDWWREVKKLSGMNSAFNSKNEVYKSLENLNETVTNTKHLANIINGIFLSPMNDFSTLASNFFACTDSGSDGPAFTVTEQEVFMKLSKVNPAKANGPDGIPS